jgi:hypothetical protein
MPLGHMTELLQGLLLLRGAAGSVSVIDWLHVILLRARPDEGALVESGK